MILESCVGNLNQAIIAEKKGAHQIELCDRLDLDGINPSFKTINRVCEKISIPIKVIVNPNPYNYQYAQKDLRSIIHYIKELNNYPISGIVFGPLTTNGFPDLQILKIVSENTSLPITFHKAIDLSKDIQASTSMLAEQNIIKSILSSGGASSAKEGIDQLLKMKSLLTETPIHLIGAGKITSENLKGIHEKLNLSYYHGKRIVGDLDHYD